MGIQSSGSWNIPEGAVVPYIHDNIYTYKPLQTQHCCSFYVGENVCTYDFTRMRYYAATYGISKYLVPTRLDLTW